MPGFRFFLRWLLAFLAVCQPQILCPSNCVLYIASSFWKFCLLCFLFLNFLSSFIFNTKFCKKCDIILHDRWWTWVDVVKIKSARLNEKGLTCDHPWRQTNNICVKRWNGYVSLQDLLLSLGKTDTSNLFHFTFNGLLQGVSRPTKYHLLWNDDDNMKTDELEQLTYYLCHMFSRCTRSVSYPAPTYNAHLAAYRARVYLEGWVCSCCRNERKCEMYKLQYLQYSCCRVDTLNSNVDGV